MDSCVTVLINNSAVGVVAVISAVESYGYFTLYADFNVRTGIELRLRFVCLYVAGTLEGQSLVQIFKLFRGNLLSACNVVEVKHLFGNYRTVRAVPRVGIFNKIVDLAEYNFKIRVICRLSFGKHFNGCKAFGYCAVARIVILGELRARGVAVAHTYISAALRGACRLGDMCADSGIHNHNGGVNAPGSAKRAQSFRHALFRGEIAIVENCAVSYLINARALVVALKCRYITGLGSFDVVEVSKFATYKVSCIVGAENVVRNADNKAIFNKLSARKQFQRILIAEERAVFHYDFISLNEHSKRAAVVAGSARVRVRIIIVVGNGYSLNRKADSFIADVERSGGIRRMNKTARVLHAVQSVVFDFGFFRALADYREIGYGYFNLFPICSLGKIHSLGNIILDSRRRQELQSLLYSPEPVRAQYVLGAYVRLRKLLVYRKNDFRLRSYIVGQRLNGYMQALSLGNAV